MTEIETRVQEEVTRLHSTLQAEKERELANIEQRYVRLKKPDNGAESGSTLSKGHEEETGGKAAPSTLDDQPDPPPVSAMVEAITKSVETTLRTILESGNHFLVRAIPRIPRRTPRWRRQENYKIQIEKATEPTHHRDFILAEVRRLFKEKLGIAQDIDFITHISVDATDVYAYEHKDGPGPDTDKIAFDLAQNHSSPWDTFILGFLLCEKTVLDRIIAMKSEDPDDDLRSWKWLQRLINTLGEHGMSSEESSVENGIENVLRVKNLEWRKNINKELEIVDLQRVVDKDIFCSQGAKPLPRKCAPDNPNSSWVPLMGLPTALYDDMWISQLTELQRESLKISKDPFPWMKLVAT
ncbi:hypothetical protein EDC04DRAFT_2610713 [Pisolithus marmoratus]|nr:hypothetical protein EDC04DRAFT_2610713 [Pisolithus marmoratus]